MHELGYKKVMLDAIRLPSLVDGLLFLTTCFCSHSLELYPELGYLRNRVRVVLHGAGDGDVVEVVRHVSGLELGVEEIHGLDKGIAIEHVEKLMEVNQGVYGNRYVPIIWLDDVTTPRLGRYLEKYRNLDLFTA